MDLLENDEIDATIVNLDKVPDKKAMKDAVNERSNNSMVPKIFINNMYIGMLSQLKEYEASGRLYREVGAEKLPRDCDAAGGCPEEGEGVAETFPDTEMPYEIQGEAPEEENDAESLDEKESESPESEDASAEEAPVEETPEVPESEAIPAPSNEASTDETPQK